MYKLLVSEFYNTLIDKEEAINLSTMVEIDRMRKGGGLFVVATGEHYKSIVGYDRDFHFIDYIISCNGSLIYDIDKEKIVLRKSITSSIIKKIKKFYSDCDILFYTDSDTMLISKNEEFDSFYEDNKKSIVKMDLIFNKRNIRDSVFDEINELDIKVSTNVIDKGRQYIVEVMPLGVDKLFGVKEICKTKKISLMDVVAIGNCSSDINLLKNVGMATCLSNASSDVKKICKIKSSSNICNGVGKIIRKLF